MKGIYITIGLLIILPAKLDALRCHACMGTGNCGDPFIGSFLEDCYSTVNNYCKKEKSGSSVTRTCEAVCNEGNTSTSITTCCTTDGCNSSFKVTSSLLLLLLLPLIAIFVGKRAS